MWRRGVTVLVVLVATLARGDDLSSSDKLALLYSHRFTFGRTGVPLVTVELMNGQTSVRLSAERGLLVLPDGDGGAEVRGGRTFDITAVGARPGKIRHYTIVARDPGPDELARWLGRGYAPRIFETGVVFGVAGDVIDSRETLVGIAPEDDALAAERTARGIAEKWQLETSVHPDLERRPQGTVVARDAKTGVVVKHEGILWFATEKAEPITVADVVHGGGGSQRDAQKRETRRYRGRIYVTLGNDGKLIVVNALPEDELLAGLVPSEIFADAPHEALKAQAVAARDELLARIGTRHFTDPFLLCSTQHCQVYGGLAPEDPRTTRAITETRGEVLLRDGGGGLVPAYYSAACGGHGEHNDHIWAPAADPSLRGRLDAPADALASLAPFGSGVPEEKVRAFLDLPAAASYCGRSRYARDRHRWSVRLPQARLDALVAEKHPRIGSVRELRPRDRGISGRIGALDLVGTRGNVTVEGDLAIRRLLGGLRSSLFLVRRDGADWVFDGAGFGHGVGMCQTGAIGMAEGGAKYDQILRHYYRGSHVAKLY